MFGPKFEKNIDNEKPNLNDTEFKEERKDSYSIEDLKDIVKSMFSPSDKPQFQEYVNESEADIEPDVYVLEDGSVVDLSEKDNKSYEQEENYSYLITRNENLEGDVHPITGVPFERKTIDLGNNEIVEGVFPIFDSIFDATLPEDMYDASDKKQFEECNRQLKEAIENNPELKNMFDEEQIEQINNLETPDGYTWHHDVEAGKMQLVDTETHQKTGHTGGRAVWGGGSDNR